MPRQGKKPARDLVGLDLDQAPPVGLHSPKTVRQTYELLLNSAARLASFATGKPPGTFGPIDERQEGLAVDDLITFAIHARRLIDLTTGRKRFSAVNVRSPSFKAKEVPIIRVINILIHSERVEIVRTKARAYLASKARPTIEDLIDLPKGNISPVVGVRDDQGKEIAFVLVEMIELFQRRILMPIVDVCAEHGLFLEEEFRE